MIQKTRAELKTELSNSLRGVGKMPSYYVLLLAY